MKREHLIQILDRIKWRAFILRSWNQSPRAGALQTQWRKQLHVPFARVQHDTWVWRASAWAPIHCCYTAKARPSHHTAPISSITASATAANCKVEVSAHETSLWDKAPQPGPSLQARAQKLLLPAEPSFRAGPAWSSSRKLLHPSSTDMEMLSGCQSCQHRALLSGAPNKVQARVCTKKQLSHLSTTFPFPLEAGPTAPSTEKDVYLSISHLYQSIEQYLASCDLWSTCFQQTQALPLKIM